MNNEEEIWKPVVGLEGKYLISNLGNVKSLNFARTGKEKNMKVSLDRYGYNYVQLNKKKYKVHQLVAKAFIPNPEKKKTVNHINEIKTDNRVENLEWATFSEQNKYSKGISLSFVYEGKNYNFNSLREASKELKMNRRKIKRLFLNEKE